MTDLNISPASKLTPELIERCNAIFDDCSELEQTRLDISQRKAWVTIGLHPEERGLEREGSWRRLALSGLSRVAIWAGDETLPPELSQDSQTVSPELLGFLASLFRPQWIYQWNVLNPDTLPERAPNWEWREGESSGNWLGLFWERPGQTPDWQIGFWFDKLQLETPLETEQTLEEFVAAWGFLADA